MESNDRRLQQEEKIISDWEWLTEGIEDYDRKLNTSIVLQNSYGHLINENLIGENWLENLLNEDEMINEAPNRSPNVGDNLIPKVLFPVIRRVMPKLIANDLVSVQPIQARNGVIYHMEYTFSNDKGEVEGGYEYSANPFTSKTASQGFATLYSSEKIGPFTIEGTSSNSEGMETRTKSFLGTDPNGFKLKRVELINGTGDVLKAGYNSAGAKSEWRPKFEAKLEVGDTVQSDDVAYNPETGKILVGSGLATEFEPVKAYLIYNQEATSKIPEMEFSIGSQTVETTQRKLKVRWTKEAEQDMNAYHKIDVESELVKMASMQMNYEVDRELLRFISDITPDVLTTNHAWTHTEIDDYTHEGTRGNYLDRHRLLTQRIYLQAAKMAQFNRQGPASWAVVAPQMAAILSMLPNFKGEIAGGTFNVFEAGQLGSGLKIYVDPNKVGAEAEEIQLGYKSTQTQYGAGVVYSPYHNWMSEKVTDPDNFNNVRGFFSRYAITPVVRGEYFYGKVAVNGIPGVYTTEV